MKQSFSKLRMLALGATVAAAAIAMPAQARDDTAYVGISAGYVDPEAHIIHSLGSGDRVKEDDGWEIEAFGGYDWGAIRTEGEIAYKHFNPRSLHHFTPAPAVTIPLDGSNHVTTVMANALYDIGGQDGGIALAVGVGAGRAWYSEKIAGPAASGVFLDDSDSAWAYQLVAQARLPITHSVELALKYKYLNTQSFHLHDAAGDPHWTQLATHSALASLIFNFGAAPPPPPPPPPPAPERG